MFDIKTIIMIMKNEKILRIDSWFKILLKKIINTNKNKLIYYIKDLKSTI